MCSSTCHKTVCYNQSARKVKREYSIPQITNTTFPGLSSGCMFSRACQKCHVFPLLAAVSCFPALGSSVMFYRACHQYSTFPLLAAVTRLSLPAVSCFHFEFYTFLLQWLCVLWFRFYEGHVLNVVFFFF